MTVGSNQLPFISGIPPPYSKFPPESIVFLIKLVILSLEFLEINGPISKSKSSEYPIFKFFAFSIKPFKNLSYTFSCTKNRLAATQICPQLPNFTAAPILIALSRSASSKTINGAFPPNSMLYFLIDVEESEITFLAVSVEPIIVIRFGIVLLERV